MATEAAAADQASAVVNDLGAHALSPAHQETIKAFIKTVSERLNDMDPAVLLATIAIVLAVSAFFVIAVMLLTRGGNPGAAEFQRFSDYLDSVSQVFNEFKRNSDSFSVMGRAELSYFKHEIAALREMIDQQNHQLAKLLELQSNGRPLQNHRQVDPFEVDRRRSANS